MGKLKSRYFDTDLMAGTSLLSDRCQNNGFFRCAVTP